MPLSLTELLSAGAQRTAEYVLRQQYESTPLDVLAALERRYGAGNVEYSQASQIYDIAHTSIFASNRLQAGLPIDPSLYGLNPTLQSRYSYTTIAELSDPLQPGRTFSVPYTVYSDQPLPPEQIRDEAAAAVLSPDFLRECVPGGQRADAIARVTNIANESARQRNVGEHPESNIDITIISASRQQ